MKRIILILTVLISLAAAPASTALALTSINTACSVQNGANNPKSSALCTAPVEPITGTGGALNQATNLIAVIAGAAAIIMIIVSGIFFVTADGDSSKAAGARNALIGAVIGLVIVVAARSIINFVLTKV
jgi:hypothetical protein